MCVESWVVFEKKNKRRMVWLNGGAQKCVRRMVEKCKTPHRSSADASTANKNANQPSIFFLCMREKCAKVHKKCEITPPSAREGWCVKGGYLSDTKYVARRH